MSTMSNQSRKKQWREEENTGAIGRRDVDESDDIRFE